MSYIMSTIKCGGCGKEMNVATGTFGSGVPEKCPDCGSIDLKFNSDGWNAKFPQRDMEDFKCQNKECNHCLGMCECHCRKCRPDLRRLRPSGGMNWREQFDEKFSLVVKYKQGDNEVADFDYMIESAEKIKHFIQNLLSQVIEDIVPPQKEYDKVKSLGTGQYEAGFNAARTYSLERSKKWGKKV